MASEEESLTTDPSDSFETLINKLPRKRFWDAMDICEWEGFWFLSGLLKPAMIFRATFEARNDDVLLTSTMKTGTTWLKALCLCIMQKNGNGDTEDILAKENPQRQVPTVEAIIYATKQPPDLYSAPSPRLFHTHLPYNLLPDSIKNSECKMVYIARNPKDTVVSMWHYFNTIGRHNQEPYPLEKAVECFCSGVHQYGPFYDHVLQYWLESNERPDKILFLRYEELQRNPKEEVKKLASFLGKPFVNEEEVDEVLWRCSLGRLKSLEVNKTGSVLLNVPNTAFFRRGVVGDAKNYLTPEMEELINQTTRTKLHEFGLFLEE